MRLTLTQTKPSYNKTHRRDFREMASMVSVLYPTEVKGPTLWVLGVKS